MDPKQEARPARRRHWSEWLEIAGGLACVAILAWRAAQEVSRAMRRTPPRDAFEFMALWWHASPLLLLAAAVAVASACVWLVRRRRG